VTYALTSDDLEMLHIEGQLPIHVWTYAIHMSEVLEMLRALQETKYFA
jgi:hypothetical protein